MLVLARYHEGTAYECRPHIKGVYYIFWSENRRSKRQSTGQTEVSAAQAYFDEFLKLQGSAPMSSLTCDEIFQAKYPDGKAKYSWNQLRHEFATLTLSEITPDIERGYIRRRTADGAARSTIRRELAELRASWSWAAQPQQGLVSPADIPVLDPLPSASAPRDRWLTAEEIARVLAAADDEYTPRRIRLFVYIALHACARRTAIQELRWRQVDFETNVIHFLADGEEQTSKRRPSVPMSDRLRAVLLAERGEPDEFVIGGGGRVNEGINALARRAGLSGLTPHVFRHTAATWMARRGVALWLIAKVLGDTVDTVERVYAKHSPEMLSDAVNVLASVGHSAQNGRDSAPYRSDKNAPEQGIRPSV